MGIDQGLSELSNALIYSAMVAYTIAFLGFAADLSGRGRVPRDEAGGRAGNLSGRPAEAVPVVVGAGAGTGATGLPGSGRRPGAGGGGEEVEPVRRRALGIAMSITYVAFALHLAGVVARGVAVGRAPWGNMYEFSITGTLVVTGVFLAVVRRPELRFLGTFVIGPVLLSLGLATVVLYTEAAELVPALKSFWLVIHVSVAFIASALFTLGFSLVVIQLVQERRERIRAQGGTLARGRFMDALPGSGPLEVAAYRMHAIAFPLWSFTLIAGAIWAEKAWSSYWSWDPKEVWSFVIWVVYAAYLHARATQGYQGRRAAYLAVAGFACLMFNYLIVNFFFVGFHSYSGVS